MQSWIWLTLGALFITVLCLVLKIYTLKGSAREIAASLTEKLAQETNTLISISSRDKDMCKLASTVNSQLSLLRSERHSYQLGNLELKEAVTNVAHDLRTPLTAICGYLELLKMEEKSETVQRYVDVIEDRAAMLRQLTEELFRYSVVLSDEDLGPVEPVALNAVLEDSLAAYYASLTERGIEPDIQIPEERIVRRLNRAALSRVFGNILDNALKYSSGDLEIRLTGEGEVSFTNRAPGLDHIQVGKLFEQFYTVEAARQSTGLGLAIAKALTERMGGSAAAEYEEEMLSIRVFLPEGMGGPPGSGGELSALR